MDQTQPQTTNKFPLLPLAGILLLIVIALGAYKMMQPSTPEVVVEKQVIQQPPQEETQMPTEEKPMPSMASSAAQTLSDTQKEQIAKGPSKETKVKTFNISSGMFWFAPNKLVVNKGDKVTIILTSTGGVHDFTLDEFKVKVGPVIAGNTSQQTFTADTVGSFEFYCGIANHRQKGQVGTLVVQ